MRGQGIVSQAHNPVADHIAVAEPAARLQEIKAVIDRACASMPTQEQFIDRYCRAGQ